MAGWSGGYVEDLILKNQNKNPQTILPKKSYL
jgi:hypothetical protein